MEDVLLIYYEQIVSFYTQIQTNSKDIFSDWLPLFVVCPWPHDHLHDYWSPAWSWPWAKNVGWIISVHFEDV